VPPLKLLKSRLISQAVLFGIIAFAIIQAGARIGASLGIDEPYTANLVHLPVAEIWEENQQVGYEITYHWLLKLWSVIFGESEVALRSLSLLFYCLTIGVVAFTAARLSNWRAGIISALLLAASTQMGIAHSAIARPYALLGLQVALGMLASLYLIGLIRTDWRSREALEFRLVFLLAMLHVLGLMNHPIYLFFMSGCVLAAAFMSRRAFVLMALCGALGLGLYLLLWWPALQVSFSLPRTDWMLPPVLGDLPNAYLRLWGREQTLLLLLCLGWKVFVRRRQMASISKPAVFVFAVVVIAGVLPFMVSQIKPVFNVMRMPIIFLPATSLLAALLMAKVDARLLTTLLLLVFAVESLHVTAEAFARPDPLPTRASVQTVFSQAHCGDTFIMGELSYAIVEYYSRRLGAPDCIRRESFPLSTQSHPGWIDIPGLMAQQDDLRIEAQATAARLAEQPNSTVWLFYLSTGAYRDVTDILRSVLDRRLHYLTTLDLRGLYFDAVLVYSSTVTIP